MLRISKLTKKFGDFIVVESLDLNVSAGEIFGFLGHNGAGKTTTLLMLTTLLKPTSGVVEIAGLDVVKDNLKARKLIGYLPENVNLYGDLSTAENLRFFGKISGVENIEQRIDQVLETIKFSPWKHTKVSNLSKGMRQRVGIAQAILHQPKLLFLDEPASGLDPQGTKEMRELLLMLNQDFGTTIFMNTHQLSEVTKICTNIGILKHGKLLLADSLDAVLSRFSAEKSLEDIYLKVG
ncbi:MAG: ABC transporter ATP-binding protein [Carboxydocellales bacterium]